VTTEKQEYDVGQFMRELVGLSTKPHIFADTSVFDDRTDRIVWKALLRRPRSLTIIPEVLCELKPWLATHPEHPAAQAVRLRDSAIVFPEKTQPTDQDAVPLQYYVNLLALRKRMFRMIAAKFEHEHGREPSGEETEELHRTVHARLGPRGYLLAKKGAASHGSRNFFTDEVLVATAVLTGLRSGRSVVLLTKDEDLQEQFYKLMWLLDTQYRGMLLAKAIDKNPRRFETKTLPATEPILQELFESDDGLLVRRPSDGLHEVLPERFSPVDLLCSVIGERATHMAFTADAEMAELLDVKRKTSGLNTDLFDGRNCHAWLGPLNMPASIRPFGCVARDKRAALKLGQIPLAMLDFYHATCTSELLAP
jgi:hypothetical protein